MFSSNFNILCTRNSLVWLLLAVFNLVVSSFAYAQVVVPDGNVAFVIASEDDVTPTLTEREDAVVYKLEVLGYTDITYIAPAKVADADFSKARFVIATEDNTLDAETVNSLLELSKGVLLLYNAAQDMGGTWYSSLPKDWSTAKGHLYIEEDAAFLKGYASRYPADLSFQVQVKGNAYQFVLSGVQAYPAGWTLLGRNSQINFQNRPIYKTTFYREHASGGRGVMFTYEPQAYTEIGENVFEKIIEWVAKPPIVKGITVPEGNVAFVIPGITDVSLSLTSGEVSFQNRLKALGYQITYVPLSKLRASDLSKARFVVGVEYPSLDVSTINTLIENGQGVMLFYKAWAPLGNSWKGGGSGLPGSVSGLLYGGSRIEKDAAFLKGYRADLSFAVSSGSILYLEHVSGGRGVIFDGYWPSTEIGENVCEKIITWVAKPPIVETVTVPEGNVAFVTPWMTDISLNLTSREISVQDRLKAMDYKITYVPISRLQASDLSKAKFIIGVEYPSLDAETINSLLETGKGVVLLSDAAAPLAREWDFSRSGDGYKLLVSKGEAFLEGYDVDASFDVQSQGSAGYIPKGYPLRWTIVARNTEHIGGGIAHMTTFYQQHTSGGRGAIFTYNPEYYTEKGGEIFERIIEWVSQALPDRVPAIPVLSFPTDGSAIGTDTQTLRWLPVDGATSYTVRVALDNTFISLVLEQSGITTSQYTVPSGKLKDKIYYWKVNASNSAGTGAWSNTWVFSKTSCVPISEFPRWDVNADGVVDISDLVLVGKHFGEDYLTIKAIASLSETGVFSGETADVRINVQNKVDFQGLRLLRVDINIEPVEDLYGLQFDLSFDPKVLRVVGTQSGDLLAQDGASTYWNVSEIDNQAGRIVDATYVRKATKNGLNASGTLATVVFEVKDFNISGATRLNLNNVKLADANARLIKATTKSTLLNWEELLVPEKSRLLPNYPNPFNPETWLPYQLAQEANVTIRIDNTKGQLVRTIELGRKTAGIYMTQDKAAYWDGRSSYGEKVASGVYYYTLQAGEFRATRKMVIVK